MQLFAPSLCLKKKTVTVVGHLDSHLRTHNNVHTPTKGIRELI